jgi:outer membrane biosynthesis protein TonB
MKPGDFDEEEEDKRSFLRRQWLPVSISAVLLGGAILLGPRLSRDGNGPSPKPPELTMVSIKPPLPPPPPPPPPEQKLEEEKPETVLPEEAPPEVTLPDEPPQLGTNIKGDGPPDGYGLGSKGNGGGNGSGGIGASARSRWTAYAGQARSRIIEALRSNRKTRQANLEISIQVWPDESGRITRARLISSTGDASLDAALRDEVLTGLRLQAPPPPEMPRPVTFKLTARRPH